MRPLRHVLEALKEALRKELDSLVTQGILAKVTEATDWVTPWFVSLKAIVHYGFV